MKDPHSSMSVCIIKTVLGLTKRNSPENIPQPFPEDAGPNFCYDLVGGTWKLSASESCSPSLAPR